MSNNFNPDNPTLKDKAVHISGNAGGVLVGNRHSEGGIKAINESTGQPLEMEGGEVVITGDAVSDKTKRNFNGEQLTNRQILSRINESGGGIQFAEEGAELPTEIFCSGKEFEYGGVSLTDNDIVSSFFVTGGEIDFSEEGITPKEFHREIMDAFHDIGKVFNRFGFVLHYVSDDKNYVNYKVSNRITGKETNTHEIRKKELWEETPSDLFDKEYSWLTDRYPNVFKESYASGGQIKPINQLGTGSNVYYETEKYRVNDLSKGKIILNIGDINSIFPIANPEFESVNEAVFVAKKLQELAPLGLDENYHKIDIIIENLKKEFINN